jgi:vitamin B12 transporter
VRIPLSGIGVYLSVAAVAALCGSSRAVAQEKQSNSDNVGQIIVTGTRLENTTETTGSSVSVVSEQDLEDGQYRNAIDAIQQVPGVDVVQSGGQGGNAAVFLRGGNSEFTLVMLDGIELNNPGSTNRSFNLSNLTLENIERIEVVRGPQSTIYGSDAMGGVINLVSKKAQEGVHTSLTSQAGSYNSFTQVGNVSYGSKLFDVATGITQQNVGGISAAAAADGNKEHDGYDNTSLSNRMRLAPSDDLELTSTTRYTNSKTDLDNYGGVGGDDPNRRLKNEEFFTRGDVSAKFLEKMLTPAAYIAYTRHHLVDNNSPDANSSDLLNSSFGGHILTVGSRATWEPTKYLSSVLGWETQGERADSHYYSVTSYGPYDDNMDGVGQRTNSIYYETQGSYEKRYNIEAGVRHDNVSTFGDATTFKVAPSVRFDSGTKLRSSVGTGFKAPSLVELYSSYGNPDLKAQRSVGWDVGVDQEIITNRLSGSVTYFHNYYDDLVTFNPSTFVLENVDKSHTQGIEVASNVELSEQLSARVAYTYTEAENDSTQEALLRRPKNKNSLTVVYQPTNRVRAQVQWRLYSSRFDNDFNTYPPSRVTLGGYGIVDLAISYQLRDSVELFAKVDNVFDKEYQEVYGFGTLGAAGYGGIKISL